MGVGWEECKGISHDHLARGSVARELTTCLTADVTYCYTCLFLWPWYELMDSPVFKSNCIL